MRISTRSKAALLFLIICFVWLQPSAGRNLNLSNRSISQKQWQGLIADPVFSYKNEKELVKPSVPSSNIFTRALRGIISFLASSFGKFIGWTVLLLLLCYMAYRIFLDNGSILFSSNRKLKRELASLEGETPREIDWEQELDRALTQGKNRDAIRFSYRLILHLLEQRELIKYAAGKTNYQYRRELESSQYKEEFKVVSGLYEYAWYGNYPISNQSFSNYMDIFNAMKKKLAA